MSRFGWPRRARRWQSGFAWRCQVSSQRSWVFIPILLGTLRLWLSGDYIAPTHFWRSGPGGIDLLTLALGNPFHPLTGGWTSSAYQRFGIDRIEGIGWLGILPTLFLVLGVWRAGAESQPETHGRRRDCLFHLGARTLADDCRGSNRRAAAGEFPGLYPRAVERTHARPCHRRHVPCRGDDRGQDSSRASTATSSRWPRLSSC